MTQSHSHSHCQPPCNPYPSMIMGCKQEWLDSAILKNKFGKDTSCGVVRDRFLPGWIIDWTIPNHQPNELGIQDPCDENVYYQIRNGLVYKVEYCNGEIVKETFLKKALIPDAAIESIDASKIKNPCALFKRDNLTVPYENYKILSNGIQTINPALRFLDITVTDTCQLKAVLEEKMMRAATLPSLKCLGVEYDPVLDTTTINLNRIVAPSNVLQIAPNSPADGCKSIVFKYSDTNTVDLTDSATGGLQANVKYEDSNTIDISDGPNGLKANVKYEDSNTIDISDGPNGLKANVKIDPDPNNFLTATPNGLLVKANSTDTICAKVVNGALQMSVKKSDGVTAAHLNHDGMHQHFIIGIVVNRDANDAPIVIAPDTQVRITNMPDQAAVSGIEMLNGVPAANPAISITKTIRATAPSFGTDDCGGDMSQYDWIAMLNFTNEDDVSLINTIQYRTARILFSGSNITRLDGRTGLSCGDGFIPKDTDPQGTNSDYIQSAGENHGSSVFVRIKPGQEFSFNFEVGVTFGAYIKKLEDIKDNSFYRNGLKNPLIILPNAARCEIIFLSKIKS